MILGKCPYCINGQIEIRKKEVRGKKVELYACSNAHWITIDGELFELEQDCKCSFRIWQNSLSKYGHYFKHNEIKILLDKKELQLKFKSKAVFNQKRVEYYKKVVLHPQYGVEILFHEHI